MTKKLAAILALSAAGLLAGGTFAAYVVTDNANPFGVQITPGTLDIGTDKAVTLDWGAKGLVDIQNLAMGVEKGPYEVGLIATTSDAQSFAGSLSVALTTTYTGEGNKLIDKLHVNVYDNNTKTGDPLLTVPDSSANYTVAKDIIVNSGVEKKVYFYISLDSALTASVYNEISTQVVTLTVDWNKGSSIEEVTSRTIYFNNTSSWANVYAYAWNSTTGATNAEYPGVKMAQAKGTIYSTALGTSFDKIIFSDGTKDDTKKTADLSIGDSNNPYYNGTTWAAAPDLTAETVYYLVGDMNSWVTSDTYKLTADTGKEGYVLSIKNVAIEAGGKIKVVGTDNLWYGRLGKDDGDMVINDAGNYDFYFNPEGNSGTYILCEPHA